MSRDTRVRTFIAIELDDAIRQRLAAAQQRLRSADAKVRWVGADQMHLTVRFLGEIDEGIVNQVAGAMHMAAADAQPFDLAVAGLGTFPPRGAPRVVWAGADEPTGALAALHKRLERELRNLGFERERRAFSPHLTLGRVKDPRTCTRLRTLVTDGADEAFGTQTVTALVLFQSVLSPHGATYTPLHREPL